MAPPVTTDPTLERHRQRLEQSLNKLREALRHWQIFSAEYEAFREELQALPADASREDMLAVGTDFGGTVVDEKEIKALLGDRLGIRRSTAQVITTVGHRIDYVQENVAKVEKQIEQGETKLASLLVVAAPDIMNEEGLPIMDIREELDEEDNIITATINGGDPNAPVRAIDTEGIEKIVKVAADKAPQETDPKALKDRPKNPSPPREVTNQSLTNAKTRVCEPKETPELPKKKPKIISSIEEDGGGIVKILGDKPEVEAENWVQEVPGESEEDAEMRREMLKYNMAEIGAVVAEINLDEDGDYYGYEDSDDYDDDDDDDDDEDEDEDEYGRTKYKVITPELQREMEELQRRVKARAEAARNGTVNTEDDQQSKRKGVRFAQELDIAPIPSPVAIAPSPRTVAPVRGPAESSLPPLPVPPSASNREDAIPLLLDLMAMDEARKAIQPIADKPGTKPSVLKSERISAFETPSKERVAPISALAPTVLERSTATGPNTPTELSPRKPSRFKAARTASAVVPTSIYNNTTSHVDESDEIDDTQQPIMSNSIKERAPSVNLSVEPPDELDPAIHRREVASEFHRMRTKMMRQQGGFIETEEERAIVPLNEDGEKRKVSRFKAARLKAMRQS